MSLRKTASPQPLPEGLGEIEMTDIVMDCNVSKIVDEPMDIEKFMEIYLNFDDDHKPVNTAGPPLQVRDAESNTLPMKSAFYRPHILRRSGPANPPVLNRHPRANQVFRLVPYYPNNQNANQQYHSPGNHRRVQPFQARGRKLDWKANNIQPPRAVVHHVQRENGHWRITSQHPLPPQPQQQGNRQPSVPPPQRPNNNYYHLNYQFNPHVNRNTNRQNRWPHLNR